MRHLILLITQRYLFNPSKEQSINLMTKISGAGIMIGTFALTLILSIMSGIEQVTHQKLQGVHAHIIVRAYGDMLNMQALSTVLATEFPEIESYSPCALEQIILNAGEGNEQTHVVALKGIIPQQEQTMRGIAQKLCSHLPGKTALPSLLAGKNLIIGKTLARTMGLKPGDVVSVMFTDTTQQTTRTVHFNSCQARIAGIFSTGIEEMDEAFVISSLDFFTTIFPHRGITQINMNVKPGTDIPTIIERLRKRLGIEVYSWQELYPALVSALLLEKYVMAFILALIVLVASMSMVSLLSMQILSKRSDIAILKALGMPTHALKKVFIGIGLSIVVCASVAGLALAALAGVVLQNYPFITLPDVYYVSHLPVQMHWHIFIGVFVATLVLALCAILIAVRTLSTLNIANVLKDIR